MTVWRQTASSEWNQHPDRIRSAIRRTALCEPNDNRLLFVGMDAYRAAGGTFRGDLFTSDQYPDNIELLDRMVAEKASSLASKFRDEGWKWVNFAQEGRHHYRDADWRDLASFEEIAAHSNAKTWTATQKIANDVRERAENDPAVRARFGVVLWLSHKGELECETLQMTREEWVEQQRKPTDDDQDDGDHGDEDDDAHIAPPTEPEKPRISAALTESLSEVMTVAMSKALAGQPAVTLAALLATLRMTIRTYGASPIRIHAKGWSGISPERDYDAGRGSWATEFAATLAIPTEGQLAELSALVATQLDLREMKFDDRIGWRDCRADTVAALAGALSGDRVTAEIGATFDAAAYFSKVSADLIDEACAEMGEPAPKGKKGEKVAIAAAAARSRGWLPPELRTVHYTGPGVAHASA